MRTIKGSACGLSRLIVLLSLLLAGAAGFAPVLAESPAQPAKAFVHPPLGAIPVAAQFDSAGHLDPERATQAYLDTFPADKRAASDKYFEHGYWMLLWDAVYSIAVLLFLMYSGLSVKMRNFAVARTGNQWLQTAIYVVQFLLATALLSAPWSWYESFYREHQYGMSQQPFSGWLRDQVVALLVSVVIGSIGIAVLYSIARSRPKSWHVWGAVMAIVFSSFFAMVFPVAIAPLFNTYSPIVDPVVTRPVLAMAHANGIPVENLYQVNASRQTTRVSANVSGLFGTTRVTLNDNLLRDASLEEIEGVTGHEMGHYVLHHILHGVIEEGVLIVVLFFLLRVWLESMQRRRGVQWGTTSIYDPALLPGVFLILTVLGLLFTPVTNTMTRMQEHEADMYGINASRQPDGFAQVMLKLAQYRKLNPGPVEEFIFFDHPSGHTRILDAMRWKSQNRDVPGYK